MSRNLSAKTQSNHSGNRRIDTRGAASRSDADHEEITPPTVELDAAPATVGKPAAPKTGAAPSFKYRQQYGLVLVCADEAAQRATYDQLLSLGYTPKVVCV